MDTLKTLIAEVVKFRDERDWEKFHNAKDLALALSIEAAELNEIFLWKPPEEANSEKIKEELADIINYALLLAHKLNFDISAIVREKLKTNASKYPIDKAKGKSSKYNEL